MNDETHVKSETPAYEPEAFKIYIDLYKHHFDLWLKGYAVYLAIIGSTAGFMFARDSSPDTRKLLTLFAVTVSTVSLPGWLAGLKWAREFSIAIERITPPNGPPLALNAFKSVIILGFLGAVVILSGTLFLYYQNV